MVWNMQRAEAQIIQFSQFYAAPLILAPSYTGMCRGSRASINYRNQWPEVGTFNTYGLAYDQNLYKLNSGIGMMLLRDDAGDGSLALTTVDICYSWWTNITRDWAIRPGIGLKYNQRSIDFENLVLPDMIDEKGEITKYTIEGDPLSHKPFIDMQFSVLAYSDKFWGGIDIDHLLRPKASLYDQDAYHEDMKLTVFGGAKLYVGGPTVTRGRKNKEDLQSVTFTLLYDYSKLSDNLNLGAYWHKDPFTLGCWLRGIPLAVRKDTYTNLDAIIVMLGYKIFDLHVGYSYDFSIGHLLSSTGGSHELSLMYEFTPRAKMKRRYGVVACPKL